MDKKTHITGAEWPIMQVLWERESATAAEIVEAVTAGRDVSMRTVKTLLRRLVAKGAVGYRVDERNARLYHYSALVARAACTGEKADQLLDTMAGGDMGELLVRFIGDAQLDREQIESLEDLLRQKREELE